MYGAVLFKIADCLLSQFVTALRMLTTVLFVSDLPHCVLRCAAIEARYREAQETS